MPAILSLRYPQAPSSLDLGLPQSLEEKAPSPSTFPHLLSSREPAGVRTVLINPSRVQIKWLIPLTVPGHGMGAVAPRIVLPYVVGPLRSGTLRGVSS